MTNVYPGSASAVDPGPYLNVDRLREVVTRLAADEYTGRRIGSAGGSAAARWLIEHLRNTGARVHTDAFTAAQARDLYATPVLECTTSRSTRRLVHRRDFVEHPASADLPSVRQGPLALDGDTDVHGHWVLAPASSAQTAERLMAGGAIGVLVPCGTDNEGWMPKMITGPALAPIPVVSVCTDIHEHLSATARETSTVRASMPWHTIGVTGTNVHATFAEPGDGGISVLLTAHYDGDGDDPDQRLPAACDNASGVAVVIEASRILTPLIPAGVGLSVALLDGEEIGAIGSAHHAAQLRPGTFVINVDGAAELDGAASVQAGGPAHGLLAALDQAGRSIGLPLKAGAMASDNRRYAAAGLPAIGIGMGIPGYQTPAETPDRVNPDTLIAATRLVVATVGHLATASATVSSSIGDGR